MTVRIDPSRVPLISSHPPRDLFSQMGFNPHLMKIIAEASQKSLSYYFESFKKHTGDFMFYPGLSYSAAHPENSHVDPDCEGNIVQTLVKLSTKELGEDYHPIPLYARAYSASISVLLEDYHKEIYNRLVLAVLANVLPDELDPPRIAYQALADRVFDLFKEASKQPSQIYSFPPLSRQENTYCHCTIL